MTKQRKNPSTLQMIGVLSQDQKGRCGICHMPLQAHDLVVGYIIPPSQGGTNTRGNRRLVHGICNRSRGARV